VVLAVMLVNSEAALQRGESCEIKSAEFTTDYLYLSAGWVNQNPILWSVRPQLASRRKQYGKWRVETTTVGGKTFFRLWNHGAEAYLVAKGSEVKAKKTSSSSEKELLWKIEGDNMLTLQQDGQFLSAKGDRNGDERAVLMTPRSNKSTAKWIISC
jgi:hypothetical protein